MERLPADSGKKSKVSFTVWTCLEIATAVVAPCSTVFCAHSLLERTDINVMMNNGVPYGARRHTLDIERATHTNLNRLLTQNTSSWTASPRIADATFFWPNLKPHPRIRFKRSTEKVGLENHPDKTKILRNQDTRRQKEVTVDKIKVEVLQKKRECQVPRSKTSVRATGNRRDQKQTTYSMGSIPQIPTATHLKILPLMPQDASVQRGDHAHADLRVGNMDTLKRAPEIDQISTTKNASPHCPVEEKEQDKKQKKRRTSMRGQRKTMTTRKTKKDIVTQKMKQKKGQRSTQITTKTVTFPSRKTPTKKWTKWKLKKKIGLNTSKEAQGKQKSK